jgi:hypothetical protein
LFTVAGGITSEEIKKKNIVEIFSVTAAAEGKGEEAICQKAKTKRVKRKPEKQEANHGKNA